MEEINTTSANKRFERAARVEEAASRAAELVKYYSEIDPYDDTDPNNPWRNPQGIFDALCLARARVVAAAHDDDKDEQHVVSTTKGSNDDFRAIYIGMITDAFAEELEALRNSNEEIDVDVLVDCLQSGMDLLTREEKAMLHREHAAALTKQDKLKAHSLTPHEVRQRQLGFHF